MTYWQQQYRPGDSIEARIEGDWRSGHVHPEARPAPGYPVVVRIKGVAYAISRERDIRHQP